MISFWQRRHCLWLLIICLLLTYLSTIVDCADTGAFKSTNNDEFGGFNEEMAKAVANVDTIIYSSNGERISFVSSANDRFILKGVNHLALFTKCLRLLCNSALDSDKESIKRHGD